MADHETVYIVIGCILGIISLLLTFFGMVKLYYYSNFHCKAKPTDVRVTVLTKNQTSGHKVACLTWTDPQRSTLQSFMCMVVNYRIFCSGECRCGAEKTFHFLEKDKARIELQEYIEHKLQVSICYTGKVIQADHWSKASDLYTIHAPPSHPVINNISLNKNRVPTIYFHPPKFENGKIVEYILSCRIDGNSEEREFQLIQNQAQNNLLGATLHVPLQPLVTYVFRLAALSFRDKVEFHGEWSEEFNFHVSAD